MPIPDQLVEQVRLQADIVEIVSEHTRLKRSGKTFRGPCPLHGGEGPNFSVNPGTGFYKCFVCGEGGTVFTFLMKHLGMSYPDAIRAVAARVGIDIPDPREEKVQEDPYRHLYDINAFAAEWFRKQLWETDGGRAAREYLERRGVGREAAERFGLGWAPEEWRALLEHARKHGIPERVLLEVGLAKESTKGAKEPYDAFRGRVIFPIEDLGGRVLAFGGRILGAAEEHVPKYLNSPETPIYHKGSTLYGLGWSRGAIRKEEAALVVEGYMDYVSLASQGIGNAVAPLGTAMTQEQAELISRYASRAILLYDSDKAGLKATFRSGDELLRAGVEVLVATLPEGEDPDSLVRAKGADHLRRYLDDAVDVLERKLQILERRNYFGSIKGTRQAIDALLPTVRATADEVTRGVYIGRIAEKTGVPRETLEKEVAEAPPRELRAVPQHQGGQQQGRRRGQQQPPQGATFAYRADVAALNPERILTLLLLRDEGWIEPAARVLSAEHFRHPQFQKIFVGLLDTEGRRDPEGQWLASFPEDTHRLLEELRGDPEAVSLVPAEEFFQKSVAQILTRSFQDKLALLDREIQTAGPDHQLSLLREKQILLAAMKEHGYTPKHNFLRSMFSSDRPARNAYGSA